MTLHDWTEDVNFSDAPEVPKITEEDAVFESQMQAFHFYQKSILVKELQNLKSSFELFMRGDASHIAFMDVVTQAMIGIKVNNGGNGEKEVWEGAYIKQELEKKTSAINSISDQMTQLSQQITQFSTQISGFSTQITQLQNRVSTLEQKAVSTKWAALS